MKIGVRMYGMGGQGIITLAKLMGVAVVEDGNFAIMTEEYSPYVTGGWSKAELVVSDKEVDYPLPERIDYLVTLSQEGLDVNKDLIDEKCKIVAAKDLVKAPKDLKSPLYGVPASQIAADIGNPRGANIVVMGAFAGLTKAFSKEAAEKVIAERFPKFVEPNVECFRRGYEEGVALGR